MKIEERITKIIEKWYLFEPLFFAVWTLHKVDPVEHIQTVRVHDGHVEYNPDFFNVLTDEQLESVLNFEAMRIVLKHPYSRKKEIPEISYLASNITIQEYLKTIDLGFVTADEYFGTDSYNRKHFEFYYDQILQDIQEKGSKRNDNDNDNDNAQSKNNEDCEKSTRGSENIGNESGYENNNVNDGTKITLAAYSDEQICGFENSDNWDKSSYFEEIIKDKIEEVQIGNNWGNLTSNCKEKILANLKPKINYRTILKSFRSSILSNKRRLTRMKPSRRYGFLYMGSRRDFTTKLLFAVDVSGSVSSYNLKKAFSIINRFFTYGIETIDVICFDTEIKGEKLSLKKAQKEIEITGRGGTNFTPVLHYIDKDRSYDGLIIFTDGYAEVPARPTNKRTKIVWLFDSEQSYIINKDSLSRLGKIAFLREV